MTASNNSSYGVHIDSISGNITITNVTANGNRGGVNADAFVGNVTVSGSTANDNDPDEGFELDAGGTITVTGSTANGSEMVRPNVP